MHTLGVPPTEIFGVPGAIFLLLMSAFFFTVAFLIFWRTYRGEKNDLMTAFNAFLFGMVIFHILLAAGLYYMDDALIMLGVFVAFTGATYTLKFPLSSVAEPLKSLVFYLTLALTWFYTAYAILYSYPAMDVLTVAFWYMIVVSGGISGFYIINKGFEAKQRSVRIKCIGGGAGIVTCCFVADIMAIFANVTIASEILMSAAPLILIGSLMYGKKIEKGEMKKGANYVSF